ncbi:helix-turn-helix domain-containing protein [Bacillus sp. SJS]|uniref:helix-turn-helix domain-containing protein n=1 Tax=Bacillus sp. SJS TaxID=1423321 RepID=UPI0004DD3BD6|nr:helix-turn-helix domain-containing protein [Bacillus sp. SJS]KZZ86286.1 hypothetical protein AS29_001570 [Bacillus sp. SJS]
MTFAGKKIREIRRQRGFSLTELADQAGVSKSYLSYIERDVQKNPSLHFLTKIAENLGVEVKDLIGEQNNQTRLEQLDPEWEDLLKTAIRNGLSKEDFKLFTDYIQFSKKHSK